MQRYTDYPHSGDEESRLWSSFAYVDFQTPLDSSISPATSTLLLPRQQILVDYSRRNSPDFAPFQPNKRMRNWCLSTKEAEALHHENVNLQRANFELNKQLSHLQLQAANSASASSHQNYANATMFPSGKSIVNSLGPMMRIGEKGPTTTSKRPAHGVENVNPAKWPKSISVRSSGYLKTLQAGEGSVSRSRAVDRVKPASYYMQIRGKEEEEPSELKVYNQGVAKTELCNKWQQTGICPYGDHCQFTHGVEELRPVIRHPCYKTKVCRTVLAGDTCPYGHRCHFRHALTEEEKLMSRG